MCRAVVSEGAASSGLTASKAVVRVESEGGAMLPGLDCDLNGWGCMDIALDRSGSMLSGRRRGNLACKLVGGYLVQVEDIISDEIAREGGRQHRTKPSQPKYQIKASCSARDKQKKKLLPLGMSSSVRISLARACPNLGGWANLRFLTPRCGLELN